MGGGSGGVDVLALLGNDIVQEETLGVLGDVHVLRDAESLVLPEDAAVAAKEAAAAKAEGRPEQAHSKRRAKQAVNKERDTLQPRETSFRAEERGVDDGGSVKYRGAVEVRLRTESRRRNS